MSLFKRSRKIKNKKDLKLTTTLLKAEAELFKTLVVLLNTSATRFYDHRHHFLKSPSTFSKIGVGLF